MNTTNECPAERLYAIEQVQKYGSAKMGYTVEDARTMPCSVEWQPPEDAGSAVWHAYTASPESVHTPVKQANAGGLITALVVAAIFVTVMVGKLVVAMDRRRKYNLPANVAKRLAVQAAAAQAQRDADRKARERAEREAIENAARIAWHAEEQGRIARGEAIPFVIRHLPVVKYHSKAGSGIYFLFNGETLTYVGKAEVSVNDRVGKHERDGRKEFNSAWFMSVHPDVIVKLEAQFIRQFRPRDNIQHNR